METTNSCSSCGGAISAGSNFCRQCGTRLNSADPLSPGNQENQRSPGRSILKWAGIGCGGCLGVVAVIVLISVIIGIVVERGEESTESGPSTPENVRITYEGESLRVSWNPVSGAEYYKVYHDDFFGDSCQVNRSGRSSFCDEIGERVTETSYLHQAPSYKENYYWVAACNESGCSDIDSNNPIVKAIPTPTSEPMSAPPGATSTPVSVPPAATPAPKATPAPTPTATPEPTAAPTPTPEPTPVVFGALPRWHEVAARRRVPLHWRRDTSAQSRPVGWAGRLHLPRRWANPTSYVWRQR